MNILQKILGCLSSLMLVSQVFAQNIQYSQYHHSPLLLNPGAVSMKSELQVMFNYRTQLTQTGQSFSTPMISFTTPFISRQEKRNRAFGTIRQVRHWGGMGVAFVQDVEKGNDQTNLQTTGGNLTYAHNIDVGGASHWSFGFQVGYYNRRLVSDLVTESQFTYGGADPTLSNNEAFVGTSINFATFSAGTILYSEDKHSRPKNYIGISAYNFNQPNVTFFERAAGQNSDLLPMRMILTGGWRVLDTEKFSLQPNARWIQQRNSSQINVGALGKIYPKPETSPHTNLGIGLWYSIDNAVIFSFEYYNPHFIVGLSYDLRFGPNLPINESNGIPEISLAFRKIIKPKKH